MNGLGISGQSSQLEGYNSALVGILSTFATPFHKRHVRIFPIALVALSCTQVVAQGVQARGGVCKPASQRTQEIGCWILSDDPLGQLSKSSVFWHLDMYPARTTAEADKGQHGEGKEYSAQYMEAIFTPGMTAPAHLHSGPEAWYTLAGETCLETSDGRVQIGRSGGPAVIVARGLSMHLTATGTEQRRALVLILHETSQAATTPVQDWIPKGLCNQRPMDSLQ